MRKLSILLIISSALANNSSIILNNITSDITTDKYTGNIAISTENNSLNIPLDEWIIANTDINIKSGHILLPKKFGHENKVTLPNECIQNVTSGNILEINGHIKSNGVIHDLNCTTRKR